MGKNKISGGDLRKLGYEEGKAIGIALGLVNQNFKKFSKRKILDTMAEVLHAPDRYYNDPILGILANAIANKPVESNEAIALLKEGKAFSIYGAGEIEPGAIAQMQTALRLPIAYRGSLMPDAHQGYGLPIGGVLATENAVIPYGVGVDIGCRMCLSIYDLPDHYIYEHKDKLQKHLTKHTLFGTGREFEQPLDHPVLQSHTFNEIPLLRHLKDKAICQIGTSGSGNHFVEYGIADIIDPDLAILPGKYLAILSHSGSRGLGANIANHYTRIAMEQTPLPKEAKHLAWLDLDTEPGQEYWQAMNLAGDYASACHHQIHDKLSDALGLKPIAMVENHHNFAWKEFVDGKEYIVHRKGATPAGKGVLGIIPGSMTAPGFIVRGKGEERSLQSASHGAGRKMSRTQAKKLITQQELHQVLKDHGVLLMGGGLDEAPSAYKDIRSVMAAQQELVDVLGRFYPKIVRMDT